MAIRALVEDKQVVIPKDEAVANLLGRDLINGSELRVPHTIETTRLLRNFGYIVPAPILSQYEWPDNPPPFRTQKITAALLTMNHRAYVLSEMGTGKTRAALYACEHLLDAGEV